MNAEKFSSHSVIQHYKKQLIYRLDDIVVQSKDPIKMMCDLTPSTNGFRNNHHSNRKFEADNEDADCIRNKGEKSNSSNAVGGVRKRKRKNKNCRGQFRHETMELIKLGTNNPNGLCKNTVSSTRHHHIEQIKDKSETSTTTPSSPPPNKIAAPPQRPTTHSLPQMVPPPPPAIVQPAICKAPSASTLTLLPNSPTKIMNKLQGCKRPKMQTPNSMAPKQIKCDNEQINKPPTPVTEKSVPKVEVARRCPVIVDGRGVRSRVEQASTPNVAKADGHKEKAHFLIKDIIGPPNVKPKESVIVSHHTAPAPPLPLNLQPRPSLQPPPPPKRHFLHSVDSMLSPTPTDCDARSVSSSGSVDSGLPEITSEHPQPLVQHPLIPQGKLVYLPEEHTLFRYYVDAQKKLFLNSVNYDDNNNHNDGNKRQAIMNNNSEMIKLPTFVRFDPKDNLCVEDYVKEMLLVERVVPRDFFQFYKFVTGYQICNNNLPVSFLTFLKVYNTDGLKDLLVRYAKNLKK